MKISAWLPCLLLFVPGSTVAAPPEQAAIENDLQPMIQVRGESARKTLAEAMREYRVPALSIAVVDKGRILWAKAYGLADAAAGRAATPRTLFQAASISKPVAATAALRLVEAGKMSLDSPINAKLKAWHLPDSPQGSGGEVTLRELLTHTAGLTVHGFPGYAVDDPLPGPVQILEGRKPASSPPVTIESRPGTRWSYSGGGFVLAQLAMTEATAEPFPALMRRLVLVPAGMEASSYQQPLPASRAAGAATGYLGDGKAVAGRFHIYPEMAAAGLWTTPSDLARWAIALQQAYDGRSTRLLSQGMAREMLKPGLGEWGLGVQVTGEGEARRFSHSGANEGFRSNLVGYLTGGRAIVVMANGDGAVPVMAQLTASVARHMGWPGFEPRILDPIALTAVPRAELAGLYVAGKTVVESVGADLFIDSRRMRLRMLPVGPDQFVLLPLGIPLKVERGSDGRITNLEAAGQRISRDP
jgi:CubicO group peptidase (beta-lactamase class C family)